MAEPLEPAEGRGAIGGPQHEVRRGVRPSGVIDWGTRPLVAAVLADDDDQPAYVELVFSGLHIGGQRLVVPVIVVTEVGYLLGREAGAQVESRSLSLRDRGPYVEPIDELRRTDYRRAAELVVIGVPSPPRNDGRDGRRVGEWAGRERGRNAGPQNFSDGRTFANRCRASTGSPTLLSDGPP